MLVIRIVGMSVAAKVLGDLIEIRNSAEAVLRVVRQADVEEATVFLSDKLVHVAAAWPDEE